MKKLGLALLGLALSSAPVWAQQPAEGLDRPITDQTVKLPAAAEETPSSVRCITYPPFVVRELHSGDDIGMESVALLPRKPGAACTTEPVPGERVLDHQGMQLLGAVGGFVLLIWPDGANDATEFAVFDAESGRKLHADSIKDDDAGLISANLTPDRHGLELRFIRVVAGPCSLVTGGAACWSRFAGTPGIPADVARRPAPEAACARVYRVAKLATRRDQEDPSVVAFPITVRITQDNPASLGPAGEMSCWPAD